MVPKEAAELQEIVDRFNVELKKWTDDHGCRVQFGWQYGDGETKQIKAMEIVAIDKIVWRKPPPPGLGNLVGGSKL